MRPVVVGKLSRFLRQVTWRTDRPAEPRGLMTRLARDVRGNTLAVMAIGLIPLAGMVGGGVDISRMYILKTRLQHACDAGALAGRRAMGAGVWTHTSNYPNTKAVEFFDANFENGSYGSYDRTRTFTENAGKVTGTASAKIPMTIMKIFKKADETITVNCSADMRLPNTDVMFVLDVTGSMGDPQPGDSVTKMQAAKTAVKCFYEIVARLDTNAACTTGTPSGGTGAQVQIRFGFVPYSTNVNVGYLLKPEWLADSWQYQTRRANFTNQWVQQGSPSTTTENISVVTSSSNCNNTAAATLNPSPNPSTSTNGNDRTVTRVDHYADSYNTSQGRCYGRRVTQVTQYKWQPVFSNYTYDRLAVNTSLLKNGTSWNTSFTWPNGTNGDLRTINWEGCIEERETVRATDYDPIPTGAKDLNIDLVPSAGDPTTQWGPALPGLIHTRNGSWGSWNTAAITTASDWGSAAQYECATEAKKLQEWPDSSLFDTYVDSLTPGGNTYHDIGLIWGARLLSPTGIFADENDFTPQGGEIERHLIFMTDGDACTSVRNYQAYGVAWFDRRQTDAASAPSDGCTSTGTLTQQINLRTEALCTAIKNKNITLWVIAFGNLASSTETRLSNCATPGRYFKATNAASLQQTFKTIADQISQLRLTS
jgi:Flp pilus assembly protein TadG